ncbi:MAG: DUF3793 family protein [Eubacterium sp.]|nr:DUF3793 family protein [Eubacterium sp.]
MSQEVFEIVKKLNPHSLETQLILQCSPLIAGMKTSNLLKINSENEMDVYRLFAGTDISCYLLVRTGRKTVFLLYRKKMLCSHIGSCGCRSLLRSLGYENVDFEQLLRAVKAKYEEYTAGEGEFPHELGLLLGYPCEDVKGYMDDRGKNALYTGYWQVYKDPAAKKKTFESYELAREKMARLASMGMNLLQIIAYWQTSGAAYGSPVMG